MSRFAKPLALRPDPRVDAAAPLPDTAMVLAAGLGLRMRPLTVDRPKALVEVAGKPLIDHVLDRLEAAGIARIVVNVHYLADAMEAHLRRRRGAAEIVICDERAELLETGGGLAHALPLLGDKPFYVVNADNLWLDGPADTLRLLANRWDGDAMDALLLVVPFARANCHKGMGDFHMDGAGRIARRRAGRVAPFVYTGIQLVAPRFLADAPGGAFSTNILWNRAIEADRCFGVVHQGLWFDVGTPAAIPVTEAMLADG
ncbi:MAG: nucleotidyltransferase family protein [Sphingomonadaceae bacterium]|nr:nucleotidyltransferase family protein [Sphingomonadaceae bacterium]